MLVIKTFDFRRAFLIPILIGLGVLLCGAARADQSADRWIGTWATALVERQRPIATANQIGDASWPPHYRRPPEAINNQTVRSIVHTSIGGKQLRIVLSNRFGTEPLKIGGAQVALSAGGSDVVEKSIRPITFNGGQSSVTVAPGAVMFSDTANFPVQNAANLAIDIYYPEDLAATGSPATAHQFSSQTNYLSATGNHLGTTGFPTAGTTREWYFLARVEVKSSNASGAVVAFGDSITDGVLSTPDTNRRWPDFFARRLLEAGIPIAVLNLGIAGNRMLGDGAGRSALARFDMDALMQTGVSHIVVLEGINDIRIAGSDAIPSVEDLVAGHKQLVDRAHARGIKIYGSTLTPYGGSDYATTVGEAKRQAFNTWIRTSSIYDGVIDFDAAVRDPDNPSVLAVQYDPGDKLHMNDAGYKALADTIDLKLFKRE